MVQAAVYIRKKIKDEMLLSRAFGRDLVRYIIKFRSLIKRITNHHKWSQICPRKKSVLWLIHTAWERKRNCTENGTDTMGNNGSWSLSLCLTIVNISTWYLLYVPFGPCTGLGATAVQYECTITATFIIINFLNTNGRTIKSKGVFTCNEIL